jgi:purine-binding chemotaxis protein CheW
MAIAHEAIKNSEGKYLTFTLGTEGFGLSILMVREIIGFMEVTLIPKAPEYVKGVINLRGKVIPVIDLRIKFGMPEIPHTERTCIIVVEISSPKEEVLLVGVVVDAVSEVMNIKGEDIEPPPSFGGQMDTDYILGMAKTGKHVKILLDIDRVINIAELPPLHQD